MILDLQLQLQQFYNKLPTVFICLPLYVHLCIHLQNNFRLNIILKNFSNYY